MQSWLFCNVEGHCSHDQKDGFICPSTTVFDAASIIARFLFYRRRCLRHRCRVIGPARLFSDGQMYFRLLRDECHATRKAAKLRALGPHMLLVQSRHPSSPLRLVVQV